MLYQRIGLSLVVIVKDGTYILWCIWLLRLPQAGITSLGSGIRTPVRVVARETLIVYIYVQRLQQQIGSRLVIHLSRLVAHAIVGIQISPLPKTKLRINALVSWNDIIPLAERRSRNVCHIRRIKPCNPVNYTIGLHTIISRFHQVQAFINHLVHRNDMVTCLCQKSIHTAHGFINPGSLTINLTDGLISPCLNADGRRNQVLADFIIHLWHLAKLLHLVQVIIARKNQLIVGSRRGIFVTL